MFVSIGQSILKFMLLPLKGVLTLLSKLPGKVGDLAKMGLDKIGEVTGEVDVNKEDEVLPSTSQASSSQVSESIKNSKLAIDIRDKGGNVEKVSQSKGDNDIPINVTNTVGAF